jgi:glycosyltransferase involved in cell wall biosynthesis
VKNKIVLITLSLEGGGAEKVLTRILHNLCNDFDIVLVTFFDRGRYLPEVLSNPRIDYQCINAETGNTLTFARRIRKIIEKENPAKVISFLYYPNIVTYLSLLFKDIPFIVSERSNHRLYLTGSVKHRIWKFLLNKAYAKAATVVSVSAESAKSIASDFKLPADKIITIYNGLSFPGLDKMKDEAMTEFSFKSDIIYIIAVGSLNKAKNYELLIKSFDIIRRRNKMVELLILGKGEMEAEIRNQIGLLDLDEVIHMPGYCQNPYKFMAAARCYVLSSRWEGFPNSLLEAMYINGHVVSTDCPTGPSEIITNGEDGILCEPDNPDDLAKGLEKMCFDDDFRRKVYDNSRKTILKFDENKMVSRYREIFLK